MNAICPAIVDTQMTVSIIDSFKETKQAINTPEDVAKYIVGLEVATEMNGKAIYGEYPWHLLRAAVLTLRSSRRWPRLGDHGKIVTHGMLAPVAEQLLTDTSLDV